MASDGDVTLTLSYDEVGLFLRESPELRAYFASLGRKAVAYAQSIAPVGERNTTHSYPGQYRDSIQFEVSTGRSRMALRVFSDDYKAWWIEYGSRKMPRHAVLRRTLDYLASGHAGDPSSYGGSEDYDAANPGTQRTRTAQRRARSVIAALHARRAA